jgi:hypothetical protein
MASKSKITLFNPEQTPLVYDAEGRIVGGAERVEVDELDEVGQRAVEVGLLVREEPEESQPKAASKAEPKTDAPPLPEKGEDSGASTRGKRS